MIGDSSIRNLEEEDSASYRRSWNYSIQMNRQKTKARDLIGYIALMQILVALSILPGIGGDGWAIATGFFYLILSVVFVKWYVELRSMQAMYRAACIAWGKPVSERRHGRSFTDEEFMRFR